MIRSDTYDGLICATCVQSHPILTANAGSEGWMMIEPEAGGWTVIGRGEKTLKRKIEDNEGDSKRARFEHDAHPETDAVTTESVPPGNDPDVQWKGKGDVFLADGVREKLKAKLDVRLGYRSCIQLTRADQDSG